MAAMFFGLVLLSACVALCFACRCPYRPYPEYFCGYDILFKGQALSEVVEGSSRYYTVRVDQVFQMPPSLSGALVLLVATYTQGSMCGMTLDLNTDIVFAGSSLSYGVMRTGTCQPTVVWSGLTTEVQTLLTSAGLGQYCANLTNTGPQTTLTPLDG
ncbi:uncharacterized protein [Littorina saxatilis]|uniref:NTR domain-containing protein n=1 Tax=Littorina saxatilis TaxID=31220 RepID=A0AAN9GGT2_9CAEN